MSYKKVAGVYKITNNQNNIFYIGSSSNVYKRWYDHKWLLKRKKHHCKHLQNAWDSYGSESFNFILEKELKDSTISEIIAEEQKLLDYCILNEIKIYNTNKKAILSSEEARKKISLKHKKKTLSNEIKEKIRKSLLGRKINPESAKKSAESRKGRRVSDATKEKIRQKLKNKTVSKKMRDRISQTLKGRKINEEQRAKQIEALKKFCGENNLSAKLTNAEAQQIRYIRKNMEYTIKEIAEMYNVSATTIKNVISNKIYLVKNEKASNGL
jgi:group I intron endonuclease